MLRIDNQRARSREAEPGADRGFSKSQRRHPVRRRKSSAGLRLGGAGSAPTAVPETRPRGARFVAALPGEDDRPEPPYCGPGHTRAGGADEEIVHRTSAGEVVDRRVEWKECVEVLRGLISLLKRSEKRIPHGLKPVRSYKDK